MMQIYPDIWKFINRPPGELLSARNPFPDKQSRILCALDGKGCRHLLIPLNETDEEFHDTKSKGFIVITRSLTIQGDKQNRYLDIQCIDSAGYSIFNFIGGEISEKLEKDNKNPVNSIKTILMKWRRFWGHVPQNLLTKEEQIGLFAELWFLSVWLIPKMGSSAVLSWNGPWGSRHDFEWPEKSVEVKATINARGRIHKIHGIDQLEEPQNGILYLFSMCLQEDSSSTFNLPLLVETCYRQLSENSEAVDRFEEALLKIGYSPIHCDNYSTLNLGIKEQNLLIVKEDFPRILRSDFYTSFHTGIESIEYDINLNTFNHLIICDNPEKFNESIV